MIKTIPVVMAFGADAVKRGIVADLARPGGNITGLTNIGAELFGKRLELLKETVPKLARVAFLWSPTNPNADDELKEVETVARFLRVGVQSLEVKGPDDFEGAFQAATKKRAQALMLAGGGFFAAHQKRIVELAAKNRLPAMYIVARFVEAGGLMSYGEDRLEMFRRAAEIVDKILKGTKPADIPVERPKKFEFVINLKAAKQIGPDDSAERVGAGGSGHQMNLDFRWFDVAHHRFSILDWAEEWRKQFGSVLCPVPIQNQMKVVPKTALILPRNGAHVGG